MERLCDLVEILENNMECVVLKVKDNSTLPLICLGCFDGDETMFRLTKGSDDHTCTVFREGRKPYSWHWGPSGYTLVSDSTRKIGEMVEECITEDFGIYIESDESKRKATLHVRTLDDMKGQEEHYRLMWWEKDYSEDICIHKNGSYHKHIRGLDRAKEYVSGKIEVESMSDMYHSPNTGCCIMDITGRRK